MELKITLSDNNVLQVIHEDGRVEEKQLVFPLETYSEEKFFVADLSRNQVLYTLEKNGEGLTVYNRTSVSSYQAGKNKSSYSIHESGFVYLSKTALLDIYHNQTTDSEFCAAFRKEALQHFTDKLTANDS